jgi:pimeloyl-ACP methyl ester carboxylesterase
MPISAINGQQIFYTDTGGEKPAIIFSHGLLMDHSMFEPQIAALANDWRCIVWDERGHGRTGEASLLNPFTYWDSADDLAALLTHLAIERAVLAGMSQGGFLSLRAALRYPDRVRGLVMLSSQAGPEVPESIGIVQGLLHTWRTEGKTPETLDGLESVLLGQNWPGAAAWRAKWAEVNTEHFATCIDTLAGRESLESRLGEITAPSLVIHGDADVPIDVSKAVTLARGLRAELVIVPGAGHAANLTHPAEVNPPILRFLARLSA